MGTRLLPLRSGGDAAESTFPFRISIRTGNLNGKKTYFRGVEFNSFLFINLALDKQEITGLLTAVNPGVNDGGWKQFSLTSISDDQPFEVWIEIKFNSSSWPQINTATIRSTGDPQGFGGGAIEHDGGIGTPKVYTQSVARLVLARITVENGVPIISQFIHSHLRMSNTVAEAKNSSKNDPKIMGAKYPESI